MKQSLNVFHFRQEMFAMFREALRNDQQTVEISAEGIRLRLGEDDKIEEQRKLCSDVMLSVFKPEAGDVRIDASPSGSEGNLTIQYLIPRPEWGTWRKRQ